MISRTRLAAFAAAAMLSCAAAATDATVTAGIDNFAFTPAELHVPVGTVVIWTNHDDIPHTVTAAAGPPAFRSPPLDTDDAFRFRFDSAGTYRYFCALHPHMQGTVVVQ